MVRQAAQEVGQRVANRSVVVQPVANRSVVAQRAENHLVVVPRVANRWEADQLPVVQQVVLRPWWTLARARPRSGTATQTMTASALPRASRRRSKAASRFRAR